MSLSRLVCKFFKLFYGDRENFSLSFNLFNCQRTLLYKSKYFVYLSPNISINCCYIFFQLDIGLFHFSINSLILKYNILNTELSEGNEGNHNSTCFEWWGDGFSLN